ncbi:gamma-glutamyltransferase family protein [Cucumibacter marinus]|uniref:gamma-glutamyltransferase family protein n=1 Tax=Cucumibacter marinus TaxID=1121252 RepID=UPI0004187F17|nr:gamma-glutamyltransferase [Cucumibacter marinus]
MTETRRSKAQGGEPAGGMRNNTSPVPGIFPPPESMRPTLIGENYSVVAGHPLVAMVAADVLERGGTAIDAGVAAGLASNVIQADMCNLGGVAPILVRPAGSDTVWSISGVGHWSRSLSLDAYLERYGGEMPPGAACSVVPAAADAWISALSGFGTWSFGAVAAPAIRYAREGFTLDRRTATAYRLMGETFCEWESSRTVYWPNDRPPEEGDRLVQTDLGRLLERMVAAEKGKDRAQALEAVRRVFYEGETAEKIVRWVNDDGGWMTLEDLSGFRNEVKPARYADYGGWRVFTGDMYCQAPVILQTLAVLAGFDLKAEAANPTRYLHFLTEAMKLAFSDREKHYCDPGFTDLDLGDLLSADHIAGLRAMIDPGAVLPDLPTLERNGVVGSTKSKRRDTTNFTIVDGDGNAFSCAASDTIDGNPMVSDLGIMVSPRGVQSRLDAGHPAVLGPGRRPRLTPSPMMALGAGETDPRVMAVSSSGGDVIPQGILQAFLNVVDRGMSPQQAVEAPRLTCLSFPDSFHPHFHDVGRLSVEERVPETVRDELAGLGHRIHLWPDYEFDSSGVALSMDMRAPGRGSRRVLGSGADPRRSHYAISR